MSILIEQVRNAQSLHSSNLLMNVEIEHPAHGWIPYTVDPNDSDNTIDNETVMALIGDNFTAHVPPTQAELDTRNAAVERTIRDERLLTEVDPIVMNPLRWRELNATKKKSLAAYRVALLDVPQQKGFPNTHTWPTYGD